MMPRPATMTKDAAVVPDDFLGYFTAAAAASGALIGLLFVSISLRPDTVFGAKAAADGRALAGSAFTALVNAFFVSLLALMPQENLGWPAAILGGYSLFRTLQLHWRIGRRDLHLAARHFLHADPGRAPGAARRGESDAKPGNRLQLARGG
jgi:hypothetical protein